MYGDHFLNATCWWPMHPKGLDDFIFICYPYCHLFDGSHEFTYSLTLVWNIIEELGWPWAPEKFVDFSMAFMYISFWWDLSVKRVELPGKKKDKCLEQISTWTHGSYHTMKEAESVIGTLNHACLIIPEGQSWLVSLYKFWGRFKDNHLGKVKHKLSVGTSEDMAWWIQCLQDKFVGLKIIQPPKPLTTKLFIEASTGWGIGLISDGKWLAWQFKEGSRSEGHEIGWGKMVAVELAVWSLIFGKCTNCHIIVCSDNEGIVGTLEAGRSWGTQQNSILQEIVKLIQGHELWISTTWISMLENLQTDPQGVFSLRKHCYAHFSWSYHITSSIHKAVDYHDPGLEWTKKLSWTLQVLLLTNTKHSVWPTMTTQSHSSSSLTHLPHHDAPQTDSFHGSFWQADRQPIPTGPNPWWDASTPSCPTPTLH